MRPTTRLLSALALSLGLASGATAALVPPPAGEPSLGPISLSDGFPIWYQDQNGLKLQLCIDPDTVNPADGARVAPCLTGQVFTGLPISFPVNFGVEASWWAAFTTAAFTSSNGFIGTALAVMGLDAGFLSLVAVDGQQVAFARIRLRVDVPVPGEYVVTHPFGQATYTFTQADLDRLGTRAIDETQDIGGLVPLDFLTAAEQDGPAPPEPPATANPRVDDTLPDRSIGPFLTPAADPASRVFLNGNAYLAIPERINPATQALELLTVPVTGGVSNQNFFRVQLNPTLETPAGFLLNAAAGSNTLEVNQFTVVGKVFNEGPNLVPVAHPDRLGVLPGAVRAALPVLANDDDVRALNPAAPLDPNDPQNTNVHGLNRQALALPTAAGLVKTLATAKGGTVTRDVNVATGLGFFAYTPPPGFVGTDSFTYVTQDTGGLLSNPITATVAVEDLKVAAAEFRTKVLKWRVEGTTSDVNPRAALTGAQVVPPLAAATPATGTTTFEIAADGASIGFSLDVAGLSGQPSAAELHLGAPGEVGQGPLFTLAAAPFGDAVTGSGTVSGTLTALNFTPRGDVIEFDLAVAALRAGRTHVVVPTALNPDGEVRGQVVPNTVTVHLGPDAQGAALATATVQPDGTWSAQRAGLTPPGAAAAISVRSNNGTLVLNQPLAIR